MKRRLLAVVLLLGAAWSAPGCGRAGSPNLVLITLDSVRADRIGAYGSPDARTPSLDALAEQGVVFERAFSSAPLTLPSHTTLLTGLDPRLHGVHDDGWFRARGDLVTVAEQLMERGYATAAFVGSWELHRTFGLAQGFAVYDDDVEPPRDPLAFHTARRSAREVTDLALAWLDAKSRDPFFVWAHFSDVQAPRRPPPPFDVDPDRYRGALASIDVQVGRLVEGARRRGGGRETVVIAVADHGESLGEGGEWGHGILAHDVVLRVPLIVSGPGFAPGTRSTAFARTEDVAPTLLRVADPEADVPRALQGLASQDSTASEPAWFETSAASTRLGWAPIAGVRTARWKLTAQPAPAVLHDPLADPTGQRNVAAEHPEVVAELSAAWASAKQRAAPAAVETDAERSERIAQAGHLAAPPLERSDKDPRDVVQALAWVDRAAALAGAGRIEDGIHSLLLLGASPLARPLVLPRLGAILLLAERPVEAADVYAELAALTGGGYARVSLAASRLAAGQPKQALRELAALEAEQGVLSPRALVMRGFAQLALGHPSEARLDAELVLGRDPSHEAALSLASAARAALEGEDEEIERLEAILARATHPGERTQTRLALASLLVGARRDRDAAAVLDAEAHPEAELLVARAEIAARRGNVAGAVRLFERALAERPLSRHFHADLAALYARQGRFSEAAALYEDLLPGRPDDADLHSARATALMRAGRAAEAEAAFRTALELDAGAADAWFHLALIELDDGREAHAETHLQRAVELRPDFPGAHLQLARLYHRRGDPRSARHADLAVRSSAPHSTIEPFEDDSTH